MARCQQADKAEAEFLPSLPIFFVWPSHCTRVWYHGAISSPLTSTFVHADRITLALYLSPWSLLRTSIFAGYAARVFSTFPDYKRLPSPIGRAISGLLFKAPRPEHPINGFIA